MPVVGRRALPMTALAGLGFRYREAAAARETQARLERVCGISRGPGCGTLLLYFRRGCSNYVSDQWS